MKKRTLTVLVVVLVCTFLTACSKEIDTVTESVNEKESSVIKNPTVLEDTIETSGLGGIYPKGIQIGKIKEIIESKNITDRYAIVETSVDFSKLETVLVITK